MKETLVIKDITIHFSPVLLEGKDGGRERRLVGGADISASALPIVLQNQLASHIKRICEEQNIPQKYIGE